MLVITELFQIDKCHALVQDYFDQPRTKWEITDSEKKRSCMEEAGYAMYNLTDNEWGHFKKKTPLKKQQDFILEATLTLKNEEATPGHFGVIWGADDNHPYLNRFTISTDGKRLLIAHFDHDHQDIQYRHRERLNSKIRMFQPIQFCIIKIGAYVHFLLNRSPVYMAHESAFCWKGTQIGFYLEPAISINASFFSLKQIQARAIVPVTGWQQLMSRH